MWMPLPLSPVGYQDFALLTKVQKNELDDYFYNMGEAFVQDPNVFRWNASAMTLSTCGQKFIRTFNLKTGGSYLGKVSESFVVSMVSTELYQVLFYKG